MTESLSENKIKLINYMDGLAEKRAQYIRKNSYYYKDLVRFFKYNIPEGSSILELGCGIGNILASLKPSRGVGLDISSRMIEIAKSEHPRLDFFQMDIETFTLDEKFDFIIISDTLGYLEDIQSMIASMKRVCRSNTRIIITYHNFLWQPVLALVEFLGLKMPRLRLNWLNEQDISNLLYIENFDIIKKGRRLLFPKYLPFMSWFINRFVAYLPLINSFCLTGYTIARLIDKQDSQKSVSVIIPARNEKGNIENAVKRIPCMGSHTEIIFIEGNSTDGTFKEIQRIFKKYKDKTDIKFAKQNGKGKGDAVRKGFEMAAGEILMILDADLTVPPEDLPKFYNAICSGKGEFINGSRLVYPLENRSMRTLNIFGNKFFSIMFSWLLGQKLKDTLCGTKVISKSNWEKLSANREYFGDFDPFGDFDLIFGATKLNLKIVEVPIRYKTREYGNTNISRFRHGWLLLKMLIFAMNKIKFI